jgi:hypothetical protein
MDSDLAGRIERQRCLTAAPRETLADIAEAWCERSQIEWFGT